MQALIHSSVDALPRFTGRPVLESFDCGEEFSLYHWIAVCRLVDTGDASSTEQLLEYAAELEHAVEGALSEV